MTRFASNFQRDSVISYDRKHRQTLHHNILKHDEAVTRGKERYGRFDQAREYASDIKEEVLNRLPDYLEKYAPDPLRYLLSIVMPETSDTDFSWREFVRRNNDELVATYGNLAHRVLTFTQRNLGAVVPTPDELDAESQSLLQKAQTALDTVDRLLYERRFRESIRTAMALAQEANRYLDSTSPWKVLKQDRQAAANSIYVVFSVLSALKTMLYPSLPFSSQKLHNYLGFEGKIEDAGWKLQSPQPGQKLPPPEPLFTKLDDSIVVEETNRIGVVR